MYVIISYQWKSFGFCVLWVRPERFLKEEGGVWLDYRYIMKGIVWDSVYPIQNLVLYYLNVHYTNGWFYYPFEKWLLMEY